MEHRLSLLEGSTRRGEILCQDEGCYITYSIDVPQWDDGVKKVWLCSESGGRMLLGTLIPEHRRFRLRRRVSHSTLRCCGMTRPDFGTVNPQALSGQWRSLRTFHSVDPVLSEGVTANPHGFWRREDQSLMLRFPWQPGQPVPLTSLFCFGTYQNGWWQISMAQP